MAHARRRQASSAAGEWRLQASGFERFDHNCRMPADFMHRAVQVLRDLRARSIGVSGHVARPSASSGQRHEALHMQLAFGTPRLRSAAAWHP